MVLVTNFVHFETKFYTPDDAMLISTDERVKDVVHYRDNILHIRCELTDSPPYFFTICLDNSKSSSTLYFLRTLNGSVYKPLVKDVKRDIDQKSWQTKEGLFLRVYLVASKVRQIILLMATMVASR